MLEIIDVEQGSQEWHDLRAKYTRTASRTSTVLGISPFSNVEKLAQEIKFGIKPFYSKAMQQGNELEDKVRELAIKHFNDTFMPSVGVNESLLASLDGINFDEDTIIEIKVSEHTYNDIKIGQVPEHYLAQIKHQMLVFEQVESAYLIAYSVENDDIAISDRITKPTDKERNLILDKWSEFEAFMDSYEMPEKETVEDETALRIAMELYEVNLQKKELEAKEKELKKQLESFVTADKVNIGNLTISKQKGRTSYDYAKLINELNIEDNKLEQYKKVSKDSLAFRFSK